MKPFLDKDFLLSTQTAKHLYHDVAEELPIIDYHCHLDPREIYEDRRFENITRVWLGGDHYKWRLMRSAGVEERFITGDASDREKFQKWAETLSLAIIGATLSCGATSAMRARSPAIRPRRSGSSATISSHRRI